MVKEIQMDYIPPFVPESRKDEGALFDHIARARKAREDAAAQVAKRYAEIKPDEHRWRVREDSDFKSELVYVR